MRLDRSREDYSPLDSTSIDFSDAEKSSCFDSSYLLSQNFQDIAMWSQAVTGASTQGSDQDQWLMMPDQLQAFGTRAEDVSADGLYVDPQSAITYYPEQTIAASYPVAQEFDTFDVSQAKVHKSAESSRLEPGAQFVAPYQTQWYHCTSADSPHLTVMSSPTNDAASLATSDAPASTAPLFQPAHALVQSPDVAWFNNYVNVDAPIDGTPQSITAAANLNGTLRPSAAAGTTHNRSHHTTEQVARAARSPPSLAQRTVLPPSPPAHDSNLGRQIAQKGNAVIGTKTEDSDGGNGPGRTHEYYFWKVSADGLFHCPYNRHPDTPCQHEPTKLKCNYDKYIDSHLKPYRCKQKGCETLAFSSTACRLRHEREAHGAHGHGDKPFRCTVPTCERSRPDRGFPRQWNRRDHMRRVHGQDDLRDPAAAASETSGADNGQSQLPGADAAVKSPVISQRRKRAASDVGSKSRQPNKQRKTTPLSVAGSEASGLPLPMNAESFVDFAYHQQQLADASNVWVVGDPTAHEFRNQLFNLANSIKSSEDVSTVCQELKGWNTYVQTPHG